MEDNEAEASTSPSDGRSDNGGKTCRYCGAQIDTSDWYLVSKQRDSDGSLEFASFCSEECQEAWHEEQQD